MTDRELTVFSLKCGQGLVERVCARLAMVPGQLEEREFEDGEHKIRPLDSVRGQDVYVVESLFGRDGLSVNDKLVRILFLLATLRDAGASRVTMVAPYLCYARKDRRTKARDPVTMRYLAALFESVATDRMVVVDVHNPAAYHNAFRVPAEHITAAPVFARALIPLIGDQDAVVVSPDTGGVKRADLFRQVLERQIRRPVASAFVEKFRSEGIVRGGAVVGDVEDRVVIIIDDLISTGTTLARAAAACRDHGARTVYAAASHGVFSADADRVLQDSAIERVMVLDTVAPRRHGSGYLDSHADVVDSAPLLAAAIHGLHTNGSIAALTAEFEAPESS